MKILFADAHELVRDAIRAYLEAEDGFVVSVAPDLQAVQTLLDKQGPFDIVLLDYAMPGMNGLEGLTKALGWNRGRPVAIMSASAKPSVVAEAIRAGAAGFLSKNMSAKGLTHALWLMVSGERYAPITLLAARHDEPTPLPLGLSAKERDIIGRVGHGFSNRAIADALTLSEPAVKRCVKQICRKLEARNRTQAAMIAGAAVVA